MFLSVGSCGYSISDVVIVYVIGLRLINPICCTLTCTYPLWLKNKCCSAGSHRPSCCSAIQAQAIGMLGQTGTGHPVARPDMHRPSGCSATQAQAIGHSPSSCSARQAQAIGMLGQTGTGLRVARPDRHRPSGCSTRHAQAIGHWPSGTGHRVARPSGTGHRALAIGLLGTR